MIDFSFILTKSFTKKTEDAPVEPLLYYELEIEIENKNMKTKLLLLAACLTVTTPAFAGIENNDPPMYSKPLVATHKSFVFIPPIPSERPERIYLASICATNSSYLTASRANTMAGLFGVLPFASMNRAVNPAAWYLIPSDGWQLYDSVTTPFFFWDGEVYNTNPPAISNEKGHRIAVSVIMKEAVNRYWCRITSDSTNIGTAFFNVATNSAGQEIRFNLQYVGVYFGPNGVLESYPNPVTGQWTQVGDDKVFSNGESPSTNQYHVVFRFGATIQNYASQISGFDGLKAEFASAPRYLKAELIRRDAEEVDTVVDTYMVTSELPHLAIARDGGNVNITVDRGQKMLVYYLQASSVMSDSPPWHQLHPDAFAYGRPIPEPLTQLERYFRVTTLTEGVPPAD